MKNYTSVEIIRALEEYRALKREASFLAEDLKAYEARLYSPRGQRYSKTPRAPGGHEGHTMEAAVIKHERLEAHYNRKIAEINDLLLKVEQAIEMLPDSNQRSALRLYYIQGLDWRKVANKMGYEERTVYRHRDAGLKALAKIDLDAVQPETAGMVVHIDDYRLTPDISQAAGL